MGLDVGPDVVLDLVLDLDRWRRGSGFDPQGRTLRAGLGHRLARSPRWASRARQQWSDESTISRECRRGSSPVPSSSGPVSLLDWCLSSRSVRGALEPAGHAVTYEDHRRRRVQQRDDRPVVVADRVDVVHTEVAGLIAVLL